MSSNNPASCKTDRSRTESPIAVKHLADVVVAGVADEDWWMRIFPIPNGRLSIEKSHSGSDAAALIASSINLDESDGPDDDDDDDDEDGDIVASDIALALIVVLVVLDFVKYVKVNFR